MTTNVESIRIEEGPGREALFDALKYAYDKEHPHTVRFTGTYHASLGGPELPCTVDVRIMGIEHEDGSGESFIVKGYVLRWRRHTHLITFYYNTRRRAGTLRLTPLDQAS